MYEYHIYRKEDSKERKIIFGYTYADACERWGVNLAEWKVAIWEYVD